MSGMPIMIAPEATHQNDEVAARASRYAREAPSRAVPMPRPTTTDWFERTEHYAAQAVADAERVWRGKVEKRLDKPSRGWTSVEIVRTYAANADGDRRFREEAHVLGLHEYLGWLETGFVGQPLGARILIEDGLAPLGHRNWWRQSPTRTVTWVREEPHTDTR
jgi:hypothetical protein